MKTFLNFVFLLLTVFILTASSVAAQVSVSATLGTASQTYTRLSSAFNAINSGTHRGVITINITGDVAENATASLMYSGSGSCSYTSILIQPSGGAPRTISGSFSANALIKLNGADNVTINGLNDGGNSLTLSNTSNSEANSTCTISLVNGATNNTITNCTVLGSFSGDVNRETASSIRGGTIYFAADAVSGNGNDNNTISNCNIGPAGENLPTVAVFGYGTTGTLEGENSGNIISNNNIYDYFHPTVPSSGIYSSDGCNSWTITGNRFYQTSPRVFAASATALHRVITIQPVTAAANPPAATITHNIIGYASPSQTGVYALSGAQGKFAGIYYSHTLSWPAADISYNTIASVSLTGVTSANGTGLSPFAGILISGNTANTNHNTIGSQTATGSLLFSTNTASAVNIYGIYNAYSGNADYEASNNIIGGITAENPGSATAVFSVCGIRQGTSSVNFTALSNIVGGTVANSIQNSCTSTRAQVIGLYHIRSNCNVSFNTVRNLTCAGGTSTTFFDVSLVGIYILPCSSSATTHTVAGNLVHSLSNTGTAGTIRVYGLLEYAPSGSTGTYTNVIERNRIYDLSAVSTSAEVNGLCILNLAPNGSASVRNNMVSLGLNYSGASVTEGFKFIGINDNAGANSYYFNTALISGEGAAGTNHSYALYSNHSAARNFRNNIFVNRRSSAAGATAKHYAVQYSSTAAGLLAADYNLYYAGGTGGVLGCYISDRTDLASWQSATGKDGHSRSADVSFTSATDLHLSGASVGNHTFDGLAIDGITTDFDGETRCTSIPYIGADEVTTSMLPVELTSFTAAASGSSVKLCWSTATEVSNYGFEIERMQISAGRGDWKTIGFVKGSGNSNSPVDYEFTDNQPANGMNVYRLKQIDNGGGYEYSFTAEALINNIPGGYVLFNNYPNPANPSTTIKYGLPSRSMVSVSVYSALGERVTELVNETKDAGYHEVKWNAAHVSSGIYFYIMKVKEEVTGKEAGIVKKMLILK